MITGPAGAVQCGCCGAIVDLQTALYDYGGHWRCEKHVGRAPCCIDGCGKTFRLSEGDDYGVTYICGRHWRMAPKRWRALLTTIRARARKTGWTDRLYRLHDLTFERCRRAAERAARGDVDMAEVNKLFGWDGS